MSNKQCNETQRQLDELTLDQLTANNLDHLATCADCSEFHTKQTRLRQLVGSLGVVSVPADFDFRLRARIAQVEANGRDSRWFESPILRVATVGAAILMAVTISFTAFNRSSNVNIPTIAVKNGPVPIPSETQQSLVEDGRSLNTLAGAPTAPSPVRNNQADKPFKRYGAPQTGNRRFASMDYSGERAPVFVSEGSAKRGEVFPIPTNGQPFKIAVEDSSGNARVITVPTVSFGSQRVMSNQYVSKGSNW